jgi:curli biogenesis system outer membrane secretion channel CsgG
MSSHPVSRLALPLIIFAVFSSVALAQTAPAAAAPAAAATAAAAPAAPAVKHRVAVMSFDYGTVQSSVAAIFGSDQDVGKGISAMLIEKLVKDGQFSVIERAALDKLLTEQNFSNSDRANPTSAAKIGQLLGVDTIIIGTITQFGRDDKHTNVGAGGYGSKFGFGGIGTKNSKAVVAVSARMVNVNTGEIISAVTGNGESSRGGTSLLGGGGGWSGGGGGGLDMGSSNFGNTILGEATKKAVDDMGAQLDADAGKVPTIKFNINGLVADVTGNTIILNVGKKAGVKIGDVLNVSRPIRVVKDPATGKVIKSVTDKVGSATITEVDDDSATATFAGSGGPKVGDMVNN